MEKVEQAKHNDGKIIFVGYELLDNRNINFSLSNLWKKKILPCVNLNAKSQKSVKLLLAV